MNDRTEPEAGFLCLVENRKPHSDSEFPSTVFTIFSKLFRFHRRKTVIGEDVSEQILNALKEFLRLTTHVSHVSINIVQMNGNRGKAGVFLIRSLAETALPFMY